MCKRLCGEVDRGTLKEMKPGQSEGTVVGGEAVERGKGQALLAVIKDFGFLS